MTPEVEAHKVIAISLGKIASSRIQRGGPKLYKNLLVANLIQKARVFFVDDPSNVECSEHEQQEPNELVDGLISSEDNVSTSENFKESEVDLKPLAVTSTLGLGEEEVAMQQGCEIQQNNDRGSSGENSWDEHDKENQPSHISQETYSVTTSPTIVSLASKVTSEDAGALQILDQKRDSTGKESHHIVPLRCLKRRNHTSDDELSQQKRHKSTDPSKFKHWRRTSIYSGLSDTDSDSEDSWEHKIPSQVNVVFSVEVHCPSDSHLVSSVTTPMDTEQITNLTSVFSSSFHGLGSTQNSRNQSTFKLDLYTRSRDLDSLSAATTTQNQSSELVVCSKQAASIFKVSFPSNKPLALTV